MTGTERTIPEPSTPEHGLGSNLPRYEMRYDRSIVRDVMVQSEDGDWVKMEDIRIYLMPYISGYLIEHKQMLRDQRVHPTIIQAVEYLEKQVNEL